MLSVSRIPAAKAGLIAGCSKPSVESYRVPKDPVAQAPSPAAETPSGGRGANPATGAGAPAAGGSPMANTPVSTAGGPGLIWTAPAHWTAKPASAMRKGSYTIRADGTAGEVDVSITAFPGNVGGDLANLNRWREQLELPPVTPAQLDSSTQQVEYNGLRMRVVDIAATGANPKRILGAMVPHAGATWFFKLMGPDTLVSQQRAAFPAFLGTVKPGADAK